MSLIDGLRDYYKVFGIRGVLAATSHRLTHRPEEITAYTLRHPIHLRVRTSDVSVYRDVVLSREYDLRLPDFHPQTIVDAGANCGMASVFYANTYPDARIIAVEPDPSNFAMLVKNTRAYPNVTPVHAALWSSDGELQLTGGDAFEKWGIQTIEGSGVRAITIDTLMREHGLQSIDLLKVDIEGAEKEVFKIAPWMSQVKLLVIELHDRFAPGCRSVVEHSAKGFRARECGELTVFSPL